MKHSLSLVHFLFCVITGSAQNVGVGTESPQALLHVAGDLKTDGQHLVMGHLGINTQTPGYRFHIKETSNQEVLGVLEGDGGFRRMEVRNGTQRTFLGTGGGTSQFGSLSQNDVAFCTGGFERWRIKHSSGFLGYNTTTPTVPLDVNAEYEQVAARFTGISYNTRLHITNGAMTADLGVANVSNTGYVGTYSNHSFSIQTNNTSRIFIDHETGNVGIGTIVPSKKLQVAGDISGINVYAGTISAPQLMTETILQEASTPVDFYSNDFSNVGFPYENVTFYKDKEGRVHLSGMVAINGTQTGAMFILPEGYRPSGNVVFGAMTSGGNSHRINVNAAGHVTIQGNLSGWVSMNGISFRAI